MSLINLVVVGADDNDLANLFADSHSCARASQRAQIEVFGSGAGGWRIGRCCKSALRADQ